MNRLSWPLRLQPNGRPATLEVGTEQDYAEQLAALVLTRRGERPRVPSFGITDPVMAGVEPTEILAGVAAFGPPVRVRDIRMAVDAPGRQTVTIDWE